MFAKNYHLTPLDSGITNETNDFGQSQELLDQLESQHTSKVNCTYEWVKWNYSLPKHSLAELMLNNTGSECLSQRTLYMYKKTKEVQALSGNRKKQKMEKKNVIKGAGYMSYRSNHTVLLFEL